MDAFSSYDVARLAFDGTDATTVFTDELGHTFTTTSTFARIKTTQPLFGTAALLTDADSYGQINSANSADWNMGSGNFSVDFWLKLPTTGSLGGVIFAIKDNAGNTSMALSRAVGAGVVPVSFTACGTTLTTPTIQTGTLITGAYGGDYTHIACTRSGSSLGIWINGALTQSGTVTNSSVDWNTNMQLCIGGDYPGLAVTQGCTIDQFRLTKGACRYTVPFTVPSDGAWNEYDPSGITITSLGTYTKQVSVYGATQPDAVIAAVDSQIVALGWTAHDNWITGAIVTKVYKCLNKDATTYKYAIVIWDKARFRFTFTSCESWDAVNHLATNECWSNWRAEGQYGWTVNNTEIIIYGSARHLGFMTYIMGQNSDWGMCVEVEREAPEDTIAAGYPCWGMIYAKSILGTSSVANYKFDGIRLPRHRDGTTGTVGVYNSANALTMMTSWGAWGRFGGWGLVGNDASIRANMTYGWDQTKKIISSIKFLKHLTDTITTPIGRLFGVKIIPPTGNLMDKISIPMNSDLFYDAAGTAADHWILPSGGNCSVYNNAGKYYDFAGNSTTVPTMSSFSTIYPVNSICFTGQVAYMGTVANGVVKTDLVTGTTSVIVGTTGLIHEVVFDGRYVYAAMPTGIYRIDTSNSDTVTTLTVGTGGTRALCLGGKNFLFASSRTAATALTCFKIDLQTFTSIQTITLPTRTNACTCYNMATNGVSIGAALCSGVANADSTLNTINVITSATNAIATSNIGAEITTMVSVNWAGANWQWNMIHATVARQCLMQGDANIAATNPTVGVTIAATVTQTSRIYGDRIGYAAWMVYPSSSAACSGYTSMAYPDYGSGVNQTYGLPGGILLTTPSRMAYHTGNQYMQIGNDNFLNLLTNIHPKDFNGATPIQMVIPK